MASRTAARMFLSPMRSTAMAAPSLRAIRPAAAMQPLLRRHAHSIPRPRMVPREPEPSKSSTAAAPEGPKSESPRPAVPTQQRDGGYYQLSFTCVPCGHRSHHNVSKQGYHTGSTLITCPSCRNRHVISDHLGILSDRKGLTIEDIVREKGQLVKRGTLGEDGDIEFWPEEADAAGSDKSGQQ